MTLYLTKSVDIGYQNRLYFTVLNDTVKLCPSALVNVMKSMCVDHFYEPALVGHNVLYTVPGETQGCTEFMCFNTYSNKRTKIKFVTLPKGKWKLTNPLLMSHLDNLNLYPGVNKKLFDLGCELIVKAGESQGYHMVYEKDCGTSIEREIIRLYY
jgi:hypothetical protein